MTSPCLSLSNEPISFFLEDKTTFDYEKYGRKFSIIRIGQLEYRGRKLQYSVELSKERKNHNQGEEITFLLKLVLVLVYLSLNFLFLD